MPLFPENQLRQAQALLLDIREFMAEQTKGHHPMLDYRMVDVFRGLELADKGLEALIKEEHYPEYETLHKMTKDWGKLSSEFPDDRALLDEPGN